MKINHSILIFTIAILFYSCVPNSISEEKLKTASISDPEIQKIVDLQDRQDIVELYKYFRNLNPTYRYRAVMAFASFKEEGSIDSLVKMLKDPIVEVRTAAAFSLGQIGSEKATVRLIAAFNGKDTINVNNKFNGAILEAVGKTGNLNDLKALSTIKTYRNTDTFLLRGQASGIYRMALRNIVADEGTSRMIDFLYLSSTPNDVRLIAANYIGRAMDINLSLAKTRLTDIFINEKNPNIRMALATGMGKTKDLDFEATLKTRLVTETDYRVKCNILRAFENFPYLDVKDILLQHVIDPNPHVANVASSVLVKNGIATDVPLYAAFDTVTTPWQVRANMNAAVLAHTGLYFTNSKTDFSERIKNNIKEAKDFYAKSAYINALAKDPYNYYNLSQLFATETDSKLKAVLLDAQGQILRHPLFYKAFGTDYTKVKGTVLANLISGILSGDVGQVAIASVILKDPAVAYKEWVKDSLIFIKALAKLKLPSDVEAYNELKACQAFFEGTTYNPAKVEYNHPVNWPILKTVSDSATAAIKTSQGVIRVRLDRNSAPGTVANFVDLIDQKFFNNKIFHRIVPNFVVQTGCPRGDGYGSLDYTIRSELDQISYDNEGFIAMASAGNHTECSQWFITHSPTLHLDGNYTIFGRVIDGMDVVHKLLPGDKINEIILVK
jgi:cyclophilin family peptidyl-prolyl cis-trans isomerase/HEAT repeat protein